MDAALAAIETERSGAIGINVSPVDPYCCTATPLTLQKFGLYEGCVTLFTHGEFCFRKREWTSKKRRRRKESGKEEKKKKEEEGRQEEEGSGLSILEKHMTSE